MWFFSLQASLLLRTSFTCSRSPRLRPPCDACVRQSYFGTRRSMSEVCHIPQHESFNSFSEYSVQRSRLLNSNLVQGDNHWRSLHPHIVLGSTVRSAGTSSERVQASQGLFHWVWAGCFRPFSSFDRHTQPNPKLGYRSTALGSWRSGHPSDSISMLSTAESTLSSPSEVHAALKSSGASRTTCAPLDR